MKKLITLLMVLTLLVAGTTVSMAADNTVAVYVDGVKVQFPDQEAIINADNRTLVPVRFVSQALGATTVDWDGVKQLVNIKHNGQDITLCIGCNKVTVNSERVTLDTRATIQNGRTMVPLRFVSECLKAQVEWKEAERAVYISTSDSDQALVDSDLKLVPIQPGNPNKIDLSVLVLYHYDTPVEPQLADLKELLEKRFGSKAQEVYDYVAVKKDVYTRFLDKEWVIDGKTIKVVDNGHSVSVMVRG